MAISKVITAFLLIVSSYSLHAQIEKKCSDFHTGTFKVEGDDETIIKRSKKFQIEKNKDVKTKDKVIWITECKYVLESIDIIKDTKGEMTDETIVFEIVETGDDYYMVKLLVGNADKNYIAKVIKQ